MPRRTRSSDARKIRDPLLLIHGMADDNVVPRQLDRVRREDAGGQQPFEMMFYPG